MPGSRHESVSQAGHTYVIDQRYRVVYLDKAARRVFPGGRVGELCYECFRGQSEPCPDCPWHPDSDEHATQSLIYSARADQWYELTCVELDWFDRGPCVLFSGHPLDESSRSLFASFSETASYDELLELDLTNDAYKVLFSEQGTYVLPPLEGALSHLLLDARDHMIHPEDRDRFGSFWELDTLLDRLDANGGTLRAEFRKKLLAGGWGWAAQTVISVKRGNSGERVVMCFVTDIEDEVRRRETWEERAQIQMLRERDQLTGLYNAATFYDKAERLLADTPDVAYEAVYVDIEHFKLFNEWYGREAGNQLLRSFAASLERVAQHRVGVAGYLGSDDFVLVVPRGTVTEQGFEIELKHAPFDSEKTIGFQPTLGVAAIEHPAMSVVTACDHAMLAMGSVKGSHAKRVAWYRPIMAEELEAEAKLLLEVKRALTNREFVLHWQPQCNTRTGRIIGLEALVRWQHPERGLVMPGEFIPVLERNNFIATLDLYVWEEACRHVRAWIDCGSRPVPVSVNISRADLYAIDVAESIESLIERYDLDRSLLELEITESAYAEDEKMASVVGRLKSLGYTILMDDFGSGYSSLNMLRDITVDVLKIDMGFLDRESELQRSESILKAIVSMARFMDLRIIAEGAETKEQVQFLQDIGCDFAQGYYFYRPMDTESLEALLARADIVDYRGVTSPTTELIDVNALLHDNDTSRTIIDDIVGGLAVYAVYPDHFELLQVNNAYYRVTGCNPVDLRELQQHVYQQVHPDDLPAMLAMFDNALNHPVTGAEATIRRYRPDGQTMWLNMRAFFLRHEQDRTIFFASLTDVTEQKEREEELRASQDALNDMLGMVPSSERRSLDDLTAENRQAAAQVFMQSAPGGLIAGYCEEGFPIMFANEEMARMAGYDSSAELVEDLDGLIVNSIHPDDLDQVMDDVGPTFYEGLEYTTQYRMRRKGGSWFWVADHGRVVRTKNDRLAITSVCIDIDARVRMQQALTLEDEVLHRIIRQTDLNVWIYDVDQDRLTFQNLSTSGLASLLASAEEGGRELDDDVSNALRRLSLEALWGRPPARVIRVWSDGGKPSELHVEREIIRDDGGEPARVIGYLEEPADERFSQPAADNDGRLLDILKGAAVDHWYLNVSTKSFLSSSDRRAWRYWAGLVLDDWSDSSLEERLGRTIRSDKDVDEIRAFLDLDAMLVQFDEGIRYRSLEYRQTGPSDERWMELSYRLVQLEEGGSVYAYLSVTDIDERKRRELQLTNMAEHDALTGLTNRQTASALLPAALERTVERGGSGAFVIVDLDDFKLVNDRYGHLSGDTVLEGVAQHLLRAFGDDDLVCRWGGDEFVVYCDDVTRDDVARRLHAICDEPWSACVRGRQEISLSISAGVALVPQDGTAFTTVYERADRALYRAKSRGKAHFCFVDDER